MAFGRGLCFKGLFVILVVTWGGKAVRVNMQGSMSLGKLVMDELSNYLHNSLQQQMSRRSMSGGSPDGDSIQIKWTIQSFPLCKELEICHGELGKFIRDYVSVHANAIETIFDGILNNDIDEQTMAAKGAIFVEKLKYTLLEVRKILQDANSNISDEKEAFIWINLIKRISAVFQREAILFLIDRLEGNPKDIQNVRKKLAQKLVLATVIVENKYLGKLCLEHKICAPDYECTKALSNFLEYFQDISEERAKEFIKYFYESLPEDVFYFSDAETASEFQIVLSEMSYSNSVPTKEILMSVKKTVETRLQCLKAKSEIPKAYDVQLVYIILSDMDHFYQSKQKKYPFDNFLSVFSDWLRVGGKFSTPLRQVVNQLKTKLSRQQPELVEKLTNEVKVFLELTIDPL